jgi:hypothetical protein
MKNTCILAMAARVLYTRNNNPPTYSSESHPGRWESI